MIRTLVQPQLIVCLGATAAQSVFGQALKIVEHRGRRMQSPFRVPALITIHPSALLRQPDKVIAARKYQRFVEDLRQIAGSV